MVEYFLISREGHILNVASGDNLTAERAREALCARDGERVTTSVTIDQLREYERYG